MSFKQIYKFYYLLHVHVTHHTMESPMQFNNHVSKVLLTNVLLVHKL